MRCAVTEAHASNVRLMVQATVISMMIGRIADGLIIVAAAAEAIHMHFLLRPFQHFNCVCVCVCVCLLRFGFASLHSVEVP